MSVSRRNFLQGVSACAVAAAVPLVPPIPSMRMWTHEITPPIFEGEIGTYNGVILRMVRELAPTCHPGIRPWGYVDEYVIPGGTCE